MAKTLLILSGPTHEYIDPVRFIGNASSGKMGKTIAEEAVKTGYQVLFITGPVDPANLPNLPAPQIVHVRQAAEMLAEAERLFPRADAAIFAAAVADYTPAHPRTEKMAKSEQSLMLELKPTMDIAKRLCANKRPDQRCIGFALQTSDGEALAREKLKSKNLDGIILNSPATLGAASGSFSFLSRSSNQFDHWGLIDKERCAKQILQALASLDS
jgi:phosphopantothenoylcysteine decarboxylase / phosphopantothenate---cysteine ligase